MIKGIIFDLGHTLIHLTRAIDEVAREGAEVMAQWYFQKKRIKLDQTALVETFLVERAAAWKLAEQNQAEIPIRQTLERALDRIDAPPAAKAKTLIEAAVKIYFGPEHAAWQAYPDAVTTLKLLKSRGYQLGLYSNASDDAFVQRLINDNKLRPELSATFSSAGQGWRKPRPEGFELIAKRWRLPADEIVVVGDSLEADVLGAQNARMSSILIGRQPASPTSNEAIKPTAVAENLAALPEMIANL